MRQKTIFQFLLVFFCHSQISKAQIHDLTFKNITIADGLSESIVLDITQDSLGIMWIATPEALNRYDGIEFKIFPKSFDYNTDPKGFKNGKLFRYQSNLWMITKGGRLEVMNLENETITHLTHFGNGGAEIPSVRSILVEAHNRIWLGTESAGLYLVDENMGILKHYHKEASRSFQLISNKINYVFQDSLGDFWILTDMGVNKIEDNLIYVHLEGIYSNLMVEDFTARLFVATQNNGIHLALLKQEKFRPLSGMNVKIDFPSDLTVAALNFDSDWKLWIGTYGNGLYTFDGRYSEVTHHLPIRNPNNAGPFKDILTIFNKEKNGIWIGTDGGGIGFFDESSISFGALVNLDSQGNIPTEQITAITSGSDSTIWYGTVGSGIVNYDPVSKKAQVLSLKNFLNQGAKESNPDRVRALSMDAEGDLWIGSEGVGTFIFDVRNQELRKWIGKDVEIEDEVTSENAATCFLKENDSTMWIGAKSGLLLFSKEKGITKKFNPKKTDEISSLLRINETTLAIGFKNSGLATFNSLTGEFFPLAADFIVENLDQAEISCLYYLNGWLWAGTVGKGLLATHVNSGKTKLFTMNEGLPSNLIYGLLGEDSRKIWISTNSGVVRLIYRKEEGEVMIDRITGYNQKNSFLGNEFKLGAYHQDEQGTLYFGGIRGIDFFRPGLLEENLTDPKVIILDLLIGNRPFVGEKSIMYTQNFELDHLQNSIEFKYTALNYTAQENNNYSYMLEGYDDSWVDAGSRKYAAYTNLKPGNYTFKVRLTNTSVESASISSLAFTITKPYWNTLWFKIFVVSLLLALLYLIYRIRINQLLEVQNVKHNISAELHDDLGARLTTLHLISAISKPKFEKNQKVKGLLESIDKEINASSEALDEIVWNIQVNDQSLNEVTANIRRYVSESFENYGIDYRFTALEDFGRLEMCMQKRREIFLICKELTNNVRKHAQAQLVELHLGIERDMFYISITDNGKGFDAKQETNRHGLANIKARVKKWKGDILISSKIDQGSKFEIWIPFDRKPIFKKLFEKSNFLLRKYPHLWGL